MSNEKDKNLTRFLLTFFFGWIGSIIINCTDFKPKGYKSRTLAYLFLSALTCGIYGLVASISNLNFDPRKESNIGYIKEDGYVYDGETDSQDEPITAMKTATNVQNNYSAQSMLKKLVVVIMSILSIAMLSYSLCEISYIKESGFTFMLFTSEIIGSDFAWAIYLIGVFCIIILIAAIVLTVMSFLNLQANKNASKILIIGNIALSAFYSFISVIIILVSTIEYEMVLNAEAFKILFCHIILFAIYICIDKMVLHKPVQVNEFENTADKALKANGSDKAENLENNSTITEIKKYLTLKEEGIITQEEFDAKKKQLLGI